MSDDDLGEKLAYWRKRGAPGRLKRKGTTDTRPVENQLVGGVAGYQRHHWDGRVDAKVTPAPAKLTTHLQAKDG